MDLYDARPKGGVARCRVGTRVPHGGMAAWRGRECGMVARAARVSVSAAWWHGRRGGTGGAVPWRARVRHGGMAAAQYLDTQGCGCTKSNAIIPISSIIFDLVHWGEGVGQIRRTRERTGTTREHNNPVREFSRQIFPVIRPLDYTTNT